MQDRWRERKACKGGICTQRTEHARTFHFFSYTSCSPSLPFRLPYPTRVDPFGIIQLEKGVGNGVKESKRRKRGRSS